MRWISQLQMRVQMLFRRNSKTARLHEELQFHIDQQTEENIAAGMSTQEAHHAAMRAFGNPALLREQARETWSWQWLENIARDVRYAIRTLGRTPGFTVIAVLVMALGIGANVALFTVVHSVLLKPLPFKDPGRLMRLYEANVRPYFNYNIVAGGTFADWKRQAHSFEQMAIMGDDNYNLSGEGGQLPERVLIEAGSWNIFSMLGVQPAYGRVFTAADDQPSANGTVVLTWGLWKRRFGGSTGVLGKTVFLNAKSYTVIGILPAWFAYPDAKVELWLPLYHEASPLFVQLHTAHNYDVVARLKPGVTQAQANAELNTIQQQIRKQYPNGPVDNAANVRPLLESQVGDYKTPLYALLAATGCLLLIACLNIANLLVARAASRRKEAAIRTALGGTRARLIREQAMESVVLSFAGGALGLFLAYGTVQWLVSVRQDMPRADAIHIDGVVLAFTFGITLLCGLVAGLIPSLGSNDAEVLRTLQESSRSYSGGHGKVRLRRILLSLEVGLTVVLLIAAGLLLKSYRQLRSIDLGCITNNVLTMSIDLPGAQYKKPPQVLSFYEQLLDRVRHLPGVYAAALSTDLPGQGGRRDDAFTIHGAPPLPKGAYLDAKVSFVDPGYFSALGIALLRGRVFLDRERLGQGMKAVVSQSFAHIYFPHGDAIGKYIDDDNNGKNASLEIVGVVADTREDVGAPIQPMIYYPLYLGFVRNSVLAVRANGQSAEALAMPVQQVVAQLDPTLPVADILTMDQIIGKSTLGASFDATLLLVFAILSLLLAAVGLFGVLSYLVAQRRGEIGIRMALGAPQDVVMMLVLMDGLRPVLFGLAFGLVGGIASAQLIRSMLYGTHPLDPFVFALVTVTLLLVAVSACALPAWRASRMDPMEALRAE